MFDSEQFRKATDYLKFNKKINFKDLSEELGVENHTIDNIRRGQTKPNELVVDRLISLYPEVEHYFVTDNTENTDIMNTSAFREPLMLYNDGRAWKELSDTQKKLIERIEDDNKKLREENQKLQGENRALKDIISNRG